MPTFQEFLKEKAGEELPVLQERRERRDEWTSAVNRLMQQLRGWLTESDPDHVLDVELGEVDKREHALGEYRASSLKISLGNSSLRVIPIGRAVLGSFTPKGEKELRAEGRVDITDGMRKYIVYRTRQAGIDKWYALDENFQAQPLDKGRLETIVQDLLS